MKTNEHFTVSRNVREGHYRGKAPLKAPQYGYGLSGHRRTKDRTYSLEGKYRYR
jgi:hypothetical protein